MYPPTIRDGPNHYSERRGKRRDGWRSSTTQLPTQFDGPAADYRLHRGEQQHGVYAASLEWCPDQSRNARTVSTTVRQRVKPCGGDCQFAPFSRTGTTASCQAGSRNRRADIHFQEKHGARGVSTLHDLHGTLQEPGEGSPTTRVAVQLSLALPEKMVQAP